MLFDPVDEGADVTTIGPELAKCVFGGLRQLGEHQFGAIAVLNAGGMDHHFNKMAQRIDDDIALAAFDFLAGIVADFATNFGGLGTLAIDDRSARLGCPALAVVFFVPEGFVDPRTRLVQTPLAIMVVDAVVVRVFLGQFIPLTASAQDVEDGIYNLTHVEFQRMPWVGEFQVQQRSQSFPLLVSQIAGVNLFCVRQCNPLFGSLGLV